MAPGKRVRAWVAIAAFVASFGLPMTAADHPMRADDAACNLSAGESAGAESRLQNAAPNEAPDHCPLCHFQRAVGGASPSRAARIAASTDSSMTVLASFRRTHAPVLGSRASRAPPALL